MFEEAKMKLRLKRDSQKPTANAQLFTKATPLIVHLLMICSVGLYAIFGALVMRKLESRSVAEITVDVEKRHIEQKEDVDEGNGKMEGKL
ncbi:hypothetical protein ANCDUO_18443 [Ancylostoma duodenale]|uniref:Uncharacterized protein n=1 Tax=Ancylostoma duodenale TaxID=51022 RepID=A0A0C2G340_9BILA|nr:hypothetical protein ANCDUO_18443 [Ancylostoma duodenale]